MGYFENKADIDIDPWPWYSTKWIIYQQESESGFGQIAEFGFLEIWPIFQVKKGKDGQKWLKNGWIFLGGLKYDKLYHF